MKVAALKAVIFDFDGLILDTETPEYLSFNDLYRKYGAELSVDVWGRRIGTDASPFDPYAHLAESAGVAVDRAAARAFRRARYVPNELTSRLAFGDHDLRLSLDGRHAAGRIVGQAVVMNERKKAVRMRYSARPSSCSRRVLLRYGRVRIDAAGLTRVAAAGRKRSAVGRFRNSR